MLNDLYHDLVTMQWKVEADIYSQFTMCKRQAERVVHTYIVQHFVQSIVSHSPSISVGGFNSLTENDTKLEKREDIIVYT